MPAAETRALDDDELEVLRDLGRHWGGAVGDREKWERALPMDPALRREAEEIGPRRLSRFVTIADEEASEPRLRRLIVGPPLRSTALGSVRTSSSWKSATSA